MKTRTIFPTLAAFTIACAIALTGCTNSSTPEGTDAATQDDEVAAFLACLTASAVEAKINDNGQVLVKTEEQFTSGETISSDDADGGVVAMETDDEGNVWVAPADATYFSEAPDMQDAYMSCEEAHPNFTQQGLNSGNDLEFEEDTVAQEEDALAFAKCAREQGYSQIADPDFSKLNGILLPANFTEQEFRTLIDACWDPASTFAFGSTGTLDFDLWSVLDEFQSTPTS